MNGLSAEERFEKNQELMEKEHNDWFNKEFALKTPEESAAVITKIMVDKWFEPELRLWWVTWQDDSDNYFTRWETTLVAANTKERAIELLENWCGNHLDEAMATPFIMPTEEGVV